MVRFLFLLVLASGGWAHSAQKTLVIGPVEAVIVRGSRGPTADPDMALQMRRGASSAVEARGMAVVEPGPGSADLVLSMQLLRTEFLHPGEADEVVLCGESEGPEPVRGSLKLTISVADRGGKILWTGEDTRPYHCQVPRVEAWDLILSVLDKAPL